jgi:Xaa-Pro dipeptidase
MREVEAVRIRELETAQKKAENLFHEIKKRRLIRPGILESQLNEEIYSLAKQMYGTTTYWHKRIVRAGSNTLLLCRESAGSSDCRG